MRLLEKYRTMEEAAEANRNQYSRKLEKFCLRRERKARRRDYYLFWLNMHYLVGLMGASRRSQNSVLP